MDHCAIFEGLCVIFTILSLKLIFLCQLYNKPGPYYGISSKAERFNVLRYSCVLTTTQDKHKQQDKHKHIRK